MNKLFCTQNVDLSELLHNIGDAVCLTDNNMVFVAANQRLADFYGRKAEELIGKSVFEFYPDFKSSVFFEASDYTLKTGKPTTRIGYSNNLKKWIVVRTFKFDDNHGVWFAHELKTGFDKRCYVGNYDSLTSLYNRFTFEEDLYKTCTLKKPFGTIILDINKFKQINESFSFSIGDMCLMEIAARIKQILPVHKIYRIGADQFAILIDDNKETCIADLNKLLLLFNQPFTFDKEEFLLSGAAGFSYIDMFEINPAEIINNTEFALTKAKKTKNSFVEYDQNVSRTTHKMQLVKDLKQALKEEELELFYQPQVDCISNKVCGAEGLIRWRHPTKGLIPPNDFLGIAEEYDLIEDIDRLGLIKAINDIKEFSEKGVPMELSVNFSAKTICSPQTVPLILSCLEKTHINPSLLTIEITETSLMEDLAKSKEVILQLSQLGIQIAIDDFGTGYSSMGYLMRYPTNYLKIDREFVKNIDTEDALQIMTNNLIKLGHSLSMTVIAEGVETEKELNILKNYGCDIIQGYYFSKPLPKKDFIVFVEKTGFSSLKSSIM